MKPFGVLGGILTLVVVLGGAIMAWTVMDSSGAERFVGEAKVNVGSAIQQAQGIDPVVRLGPEGGVAELDMCTGEFIEMTEYRAPDILPVYSAHNNCGGDIILPWENGQHVRIAGRNTTYKVVEHRDILRDTQINKLHGMRGELLLQTCYYGQKTMRFVALEPVR